MNVDTLKALLIQIPQISKHYDKIATLTGENFNVFRTLKLESSEVQMHSAFLAEFLNPQGTHGQSDLYLRLFLEQFKEWEKLKASNFDTKSASAKVEEYIGSIDADYTKGGRIDILLTDQNDNHIIIENKIYAKDQKNQLVRYHEFDDKAPIFYLNLDETEPTDWSTGGQLDKNQYLVISYRTDIVQWLEKCRKESVSLPIIRETIAQYTNLLRYLTNQTTGDKMKKEIEKLIMSNPEYVDSIDLCCQVLNEIIDKTNSQFKKLLNEKFPGVKISLSNGVTIKINWVEDIDGVCFGYKAMEDENNISGSDKVKSYVKILKEIEPGFYSNSNWIGWFNPDPFVRRQKFKDLNKNLIIEMFDESKELEKFVDDLIAQEGKIRQDFLNKAKANIATTI